MVVAMEVESVQCYGGGGSESPDPSLHVLREDKYGEGVG